MISIPELEKLSEDLQKEIDKLQQFMKFKKGHPESERLVVRTGENGRYKYYAATRDSNGNKHERSLNRNIKQAVELAARGCAELRLMDANEEKKSVDRMLKTLREEGHIARYMSAHPGQAELINEWIKKTGIEGLRKEELEIFEAVEAWKNQPYSRSKAHPENLTVPTGVSGLNVRSKSEAMWVSLLEEKHAAYHYEEELQFVDDRGRSVVIAPDFHCANLRVRKHIIIEHLGMVDDENYMKDFKWKLEVYRRNGYYLGKNLLVTTETKDSPLDINIAKWIVDYWLL